MQSLVVILACVLVCKFCDKAVECCGTYQLRKISHTSLNCISPNHTCRELVNEAEQCAGILYCYGILKYRDGLCNQCILASAEDPTYISSVSSDLYLLINVSKDARWEMVFKMNKGTDQSSYDLWSNEGATNNQDNCNANPATNCQENYKSERVDTWQGISEVQIEMYDEGIRVAFGTFDARGSTNANWMARERLLNSSWDDVQDYMQSADTVTVSVSGKNLSPGVDARFVLHSTILNCGSKCDQEGGWMIIFDISESQNTQCGLPTVGTTGPVMRYSIGSGRGKLLTDRHGVYLTYDPSVGHYTTYYSDYASVCSAQDSDTVSYDDLVASYTDGLESCHCGWINDGTNRFPMQSAHEGCGNAMGLILCGRTQASSWCRRDPSLIGEAETMVIYVR